MGLVVTIDLDHANDIHPPNKIDVGERLARWPLAWFHGRELAVQGPVFHAAEVRGGEIHVMFDHAEGGLMAGRHVGPGQPVVDSGSATINGCELCDDQGSWHAAEGRIFGPRLVVSSPEVPRPVAVRYACLPEAPKQEAGNGAEKESWNLFGTSGLPAGPFCSDAARMPYEPAKNPR
jgi:sialate O-acetylesterase